MNDLLVVGDPHLSDVSPGARIDDYKSSILAKFNFLKNYCNLNNVKCVLILGDIFHRKNPFLNSHHLVRELISLFNSFSSKVVVVPGNHDISMSAANLDRQPLSVLEESGAITILGFPYSKVHSASFDTFNIYGLAYSEKNESFNDNYNFNLDSGSYKKANILAVHQTLLPTGDKFFGNYLNFCDLRDTLYDVVCCGHFHPGYKNSVIEEDGKLFCNPGALSRGSLDSHNLEREVNAVLFNFGSGTVDYSVVKVPTLPVEEVFDLVKVKSCKVNKEEVASFVNIIKDISEEEIDITSIDGILDIVKSMGVSEDLITFIKKRLISAKEELLV